MSTVEFIIKSITPANGEEEVALNKAIKISFSENMNKESVEDPKRIVLSDSDGPVLADYEYNSINKELVIYTNNLKPDELHHIKIHSKDKGPYTVFSKVIKNDYDFMFRTRGEKKESYLQEETDTSQEPSGDTESESKEEDISLYSEEEDGYEILYDAFEENSTNGIRLVESFPEPGDLVELDGQMVFVFNQPISKDVLEDNIFVKENKLNRLLERLNSNQGKLLTGTVETENGETEDTTFIFKPTQQLKPGHEYQVVIRKELSPNMQEDLRITFHTLFERMFADVDTVRLILGRFSERLTDLDLAKLINQQSNSIFQLASMMDTFLEEQWVEESGVIVQFPYAAGQYVVYSTAYYAILGQALETSSGISESIKLADLSVSGSSEVSDNLSDLLEMLKAEFERWWNALQGEAEEIDPLAPNPNYSMMPATRGGDSSPYPDFQTRVPFTDLGGGV